MEWKAAVGDTNFGFHLGVRTANTTAILEIKIPKHTREWDNTCIINSHLVDLVTHVAYDHLRPICRPKSSPSPPFFTLPPTAHVFLSTCNSSSRGRMWLSSKAAERRLFSQTYWSLRQTVDFFFAFVFKKEHKLTRLDLHVKRGISCFSFVFFIVKGEFCLYWMLWMRLSVFCFFLPVTFGILAATTSFQRTTSSFL